MAAVYVLTGVKLWPANTNYYEESVLFFFWPLPSRDRSSEQAAVKDFVNVFIPYVHPDPTWTQSRDCGTNSRATATQILISFALWLLVACLFIYFFISSQFMSQRFSISHEQADFRPDGQLMGLGEWRVEKKKTFYNSKTANQSVWKCARSQQFSYVAQFVPSYANFPLQLPVRKLSNVLHLSPFQPNHSQGNPSNSLSAENQSGF